MVNKSGKCNSFAALLYYSHILTDYLADNPDETETNVNGKITPAFVGTAYTEINGNRPSFTADQKKNIESYIKFSTLDGQGRAGVAYGCIGLDTLDAVGPRQNMVGITPSGWNFNKYEGIVNAQPAYVSTLSHVYDFGDQQFAAIYEACSTGLEKWNDVYCRIFTRFSRSLQATALYHRPGCWRCLCICVF